MGDTMPVPKVVYSIRIDGNLKDAYLYQCERHQLDHADLMAEMMRKSIVVMKAEEPK